MCSGSWAFTPSTVTTAEPGYRKSTVCYAFQPWQSYFIGRVVDSLAAWTAHLRLPPFDLDYVECQLTRSGDGEFFKRHQDTGDQATNARVISFVYYVSHMPQIFTGGELVLEAPTGEKITVHPDDNSCVIFPSNAWHEVMPIAVPKDVFGFGRFTAGGWVRRK